MAVGMAEKMAEGVGFEPTVSCPTFDFESSAFNRAQPPFRCTDPRLAEAFVKAGNAKVA